MKKILAILTACIALTSCSKVGNATNTENNGESPAAGDMSQAEALSAVPNGYKTQELDMPEMCSYIDNFVTFPDSPQIYTNGFYSQDFYDSCHTGWFITDPTQTTNMFSNFYVDFPPEYETADFASSLILFNNDRSYFTFNSYEDHGGMRLPDGVDESFDYEAYNANRVATYALCSYNNSGKLLSNTPIEFPDEFYDDYGYLNVADFIADDDSILISTYNGKIFRLSENGESRQIFALEGEEFSVTAPLFKRDRDGKIIVCIETLMSDKDGNEMLCTGLCDLGDDESVGEPFYILDGTNFDCQYLTQGSGNYRLYFSAEDGLYGITESGESELIIDYEDTGLQQGITISSGENEYLTFISGANGSDSQLYKVVPRAPGEGADLIEVTLACPYGIPPREMMNKFNNSQNVYKIKSMDFERTEEEEMYSNDNSALNLALISGNAPDIIYDMSYTTYQNYQHKGVFTDLYTLMENDPNVNKNTLLPNVLKAMEASDGSLYAISDFFGVGSMVIKSKVWDKNNWTLDEMIELYDNPPVNAIHRYDEYNKEEMLEKMYYCMDELIDYETATCNFQSEDFIKLLEFCNRFVDIVPKPDKAVDGEVANQNYWNDRFKWLGQDAILSKDFGLTDYNMVKYLNGNGEDLTIVGYPSSNGKGGRIGVHTLMAVTENSDCKEGAWAFISYCMQHCQDNDPYYYNGIPLLTEGFDKYMDHTMHANRTASGNEIPNFTQEDRDMVADYIKSCDTLATVLDDDVNAVCLEEAQLYFAGQQTVEQTAEHIQNRVSIIISEKS